VTRLCSPLNRETLETGEQLRFDHGAQYFSAKDPALEALVQEWLAAGVAALWSPRLGSWEAGGGFVPEEVNRFGHNFVRSWFAIARCGEVVM
jgi:predicted NAD/FAD-dependent oxidoreductase